MSNIAVLGGGNGAFATAAYLSSKGHEVSLSEHPRFRASLETVRRQHGIRASGVAAQGLQPVTVKELDAALAEADLAILCVPAFGIEAWAEAARPHLRRDQLLVLNGSACGGTLRFARRLAETAPARGPRLAETASLTFGCRKTGPGEVRILLLTQGVFFAAFPGNAGVTAAETFGRLFPITPCRNVLDTMLNNGNPVSHVAPAVLNAGRIERARGEFYLYPEGISPSVARVMEEVDAERLALCRAVSAPQVPSRERIVKYGYARPAESLWATYQNSDVYPAVKGPASLDDRFLTEDVPFGLALWSDLGRTLRIPTPHIDALVKLAGTLLGERMPKALGLADLGLGGMDAARMVDNVTRGS